MVTSAMLRTCAVRLPAIWLTESVSSFHTPETRFTWAWPPSLPSVPTSRATRVTSEVKTESCSIMVFTSLAERRNSPRSSRPSTSSSMACPRSPLATAPMVRAISVVGRTRSSISVLTESTFAAHWPIAPGTAMRCLSRPSLPTVTLNFVISSAMSCSRAMVWLKASAVRASVPAQSVGKRTAKSPSRNDTIAVRIIRERASAESLVESRCLPVRSEVLLPWLAADEFFLRGGRRAGGFMIEREGGWRRRGPMGLRRSGAGRSPLVRTAEDKPHGV